MLLNEPVAVQASIPTENVKGCLQLLLPSFFVDPILFLIESRAVHIKR